MMVTHKPRRLASSKIIQASQTADHRAQLVECQIAELMALAAIQAGTHTADDIHRLDCLARIAKSLNPTLGHLVAATRSTLRTDKPNAQLVANLIQHHDHDRLAVTGKRYQQAIDLA